MSKLNILALSGSLRQASTNTLLLRTASELAPDTLELTVYDYREVPLYNGDLETPASVGLLNAAINGADGVLLAVPEFNYSMPGVLKNAIDWSSRPAYKSVFRDKPCGVISAAASPVGGARGQQHAKQVLLGMASQVFNWPDFLVARAMTKFENDKLTDEGAREALTRYMAGFADWVARVKV